MNIVHCLLYNECICIMLNFCCWDSSCICKRVRSDKKGMGQQAPKPNLAALSQGLVFSLELRGAEQPW